MQVGGYNRPYRAPPNPPPRKYTGRAYYNPSMVDADDDRNMELPHRDLQSPYPTPAPRPDHSFMKSDSSHPPDSGNVSLSHLNAEHSLSPPPSIRRPGNRNSQRPPSERRYTSSTPEQQYPTRDTDPADHSSDIQGGGGSSGASSRDNVASTVTLSSRDNTQTSSRDTDSVFLPSSTLPAGHSLLNRSAIRNDRNFDTTRFRGVAPSYNNVLNMSQTDTLRSILKDPDKSYTDSPTTHRRQYEVQIQTPEQYPYHKQNGVISPVHTPDHSLHSLELSRISNVNNSAVSVSHYNNNNNSNTSTQDDSTMKDDLGVRNNLLNVTVLALLSLVLAGVSLQLLLLLTTAKIPRTEGNVIESVLTLSSYDNTREVCVCLCSLVLMLNICALMVCALQTFFAIKLLRCNDGNIR